MIPGGQRPTGSPPVTRPRAHSETLRGGHSVRSRWSPLSRAELVRASQLLARLDALADRQRSAIARLAGPELVELTGDQSALEGELRSILEAAGGGSPADPAIPAELAALATLTTRVRRAFQHNLALLAHARRSVSLLLGIDEDRAAYDRRARRLSTPISAHVRAV